MRTLVPGLLRAIAIWPAAGDGKPDAPGVVNEPPADTGLEAGV
tara:strand:+ start:364 stop:492 length:129 start_codon:yes stop_codon:yes gene_type:complete